jgi:hypothetical protein
MKLSTMERTAKLNHGRLTGRICSANAWLSNPDLP